MIEIVNDLLLLNSISQLLRGVFAEQGIKAFVIFSDWYFSFLVSNFDLAFRKLFVLRFLVYSIMIF